MPDLAPQPLGTLIWTDTFDTYTAGPISAPWVVYGAGNSFFSAAQAHSGANSLGVGSGGGASDTYRPFGSNQSQWYADFWMWTNSSGGTVPANQCVAFPSVTNATAAGQGTAPYISVLQTGAGQAGPSGGTAWFTFSVSTGAWHHYLFELTQAAAGTAKLTVDGTVIGTYSGDTRDSTNAYAVCAWAKGGNIGPSPPAEFYVDDLSIYSGVVVTSVPPPTGRAYMITASRAGIPSAVLWSTTTRSFMLPLSVALSEAAAPAPLAGASQARVLVMA